jgi:RNA polymerase sigma-70 factor (ECF subfamily)
MTAMAEKPDEQALVERFHRGDDSAFDGIVARHSAEVAALANRLLGWPQDVDDVVQDIFVAAFTGLRTFRGASRLRTWLFTITLNTCRSHRHRRRHRLRLITTDGPEPVCNDSGEKTAMDAETFAEVRRAVQALPPKYREVIVLRYLQALDASEIAGLLGIRVNAVQVRLNRARKRLKEQLGDLIEEEA